MCFLYKHILQLSTSEGNVTVLTKLCLEVYIRYGIWQIVHGCAIMMLTMLLIGTKQVRYHFLLLIISVWFKELTLNIAKKQAEFADKISIYWMKLIFYVLEVYWGWFAQKILEWLNTKFRQFIKQSAVLLSDILIAAFVMPYCELSLIKEMSEVVYCCIQ